MTAIIVMIYFIFHSLILYVYDYKIMSIHTLYIILICIYLYARKQPKQYENNYNDVSYTNNKNEQYVMCNHCQKPKYDRYHHCRSCRNCIYRMDHHCQWISNCVGHFNIKPFLHFIINLFGHSIVLLGLFVYNFFEIIKNQNRQVYILFTCLPTIFIAFQTRRLVFESYQMIKNNQTLIDSYKLTKGRKLSIMACLKEYLGENVILWGLFFYTGSENTHRYSYLKQKMIKTTQTKQDAEFADQYIYGRESDDQEQLQILKQSISQNN